MHTFYYGLLFLLQYSNSLRADISTKESSNVVLSYSNGGYKSVEQTNCTTTLTEFAECASSFTKCTILNARPITLCEQCIDQYMKFHNKYQELLTEVDNGTSCKSLFISQDRLDVVLEYHDNIQNIWNKGHCSACYDWSNPALPVLSNETKRFNSILDETNTCIEKYRKINDSEACAQCMGEYLQLDKYYKTLSADAIGVDSVCMDVVDSMNATRSTWSKTLNCCKIRRTPEFVFLCCAGIISVLPLLYYVILRFFNPIRNFPNVLKQSRFKQTILRSLNRRRSD